ncbi:LOW QUALITY PROTEIN: transmembrane protease serine 9-like [Cylas formicarius]|uniref:LOW QUALITY PROTEIN: transmembrane protease serine 9-like n=1 Tax=Cylas formicarius TaxID=197179 RepID=UPI0029589FC9|nr:LOW QUALITY PROTEIN: transmembrane protease serine 9-like [Cylas formicarius]
MKVIICVVALLGLSLADSSLVSDIDLANVTHGTIGGRIVGGVPVDIRNFPYQVAILRNGAQICGGTLISARWVVTAAHCLDSEIITSVTQLNVRVGSTVHNSGGQRIAAQSYRLHENYRLRQVDYDIALIYLASAVTSPNAAAIALDPATRDYSAGEVTTISGWGDLWEGARQGSLTLQAVQVPVVSRTSCRNIYGSVITSRVWCAGTAAGGGRRDSCQGDSGGPAIVAGRFAGVVNFGAGCARPGLPGVYASIPFYRNWIRTHSGICPNPQRTDHIQTFVKMKVTICVLALFGLSLADSSLVSGIDFANVTHGTIGGRIVGGVPVDIRDFPYQVAILRNGAQICGGTLISARWVVTAAHCLDSDVITSVTQLNVRVGSTVHNSGGQRIAAQSYRLHENYRLNSVDYDIALIYLASAVTSQNAAAIALDPATRDYSAGEVSTISGWGDLWEGARQGSITLQAVQVPVVSRTSCRNVYGSVITDRVWCAGTAAGGRDSCQGDSGGPAIVAGRFAGVVNFGAGCARPGLPGVYASIPFYRNWIRTHSGI